VSLERTPPANVELEMCILGGIMLEPKAAYPIAADILKPEYFYIEGHRVLFTIMGEMHERGIPPDCNVVLDELYSRKLENVVPKSDVMAMLNSVPSAAGIASHARKVADKARLRALIRVSVETIEDCHRQDMAVEDVLDKAEQGIMMLSASGGGPDYRMIGDVAVEYWQAMSDRADQMEEYRTLHPDSDLPNLLTGLSTGYDALDRETGGLGQGEMTIVAALTSHGKTAFALSIMRHLAIKKDIPCAMFALEMSDQRLGERILCMGTKYWAGNQIRYISTSMLRSPAMSQQEWNVLTQAYNEILQAPIAIINKNVLSIQQLRHNVRSLISKQGIKLLVVDYLQLMCSSDPTANRAQEVAQISRGLKQLARELGIHVLALSQFSRAASGGGRPQLSWLKESGAIEQDADNVIFVYRDHAPEKPKPCPPSYAISDLEPMQLLLAKNRNGPTMDIDARWLAPLALVMDTNKL